MFTLEDTIALMEEATQSLPDSIQGDTELVSIDGWDSMGIVYFLELAQDKAGVELGARQLRDCRDCAALHALLLRERRG